MGALPIRTGAMGRIEMGAEILVVVSIGAALHSGTELIVLTLVCLLGLGRSMTQS